MIAFREKKKKKTFPKGLVHEVPDSGWRDFFFSNLIGTRGKFTYIQVKSIFKLAPMS